jgi:argininosuccinate synthase
LEGSTGKGNDQYRMHNVFKFFAPKLEILVPVRDFDLTRTEEAALCAHWGIPVTEQITGGDDKTMWCRSIASGAIGLNQQIPDDVWLWLKLPQQAPDKPTEISISFKQGVPVALNNQTMPLDALIENLNTTAGNNGIGLIDIFEDGIMSLKSREIYEAPAATVILNLHKDLEQACLTKEEIQFKKIVDSQWAYLVYHGLWYHPLKEALDAFVKTTQHFVNGTYVITLYKGTMTITQRILPTSLFYPEVRSITSKAFNQQWCANAAKIMGLPIELLAQRLAKEGQS